LCECNRPNLIGSRTRVARTALLHAGLRWVRTPGSFRDHGLDFSKSHVRLLSDV
jgi:hypothetical protein